MSVQCLNLSVFCGVLSIRVAFREDAVFPVLNFFTRLKSYPLYYYYSVHARDITFFFGIKQVSRLKLICKTNGSFRLTSHERGYISICHDVDPAIAMNIAGRRILTSHMFRPLSGLAPHPSSIWPALWGLPAVSCAARCTEWYVRCYRPCYRPDRVHSGHLSASGHPPVRPVW